MISLFAPCFLALSIKFLGGTRFYNFYGNFEAESVLKLM